MASAKKPSFRRVVIEDSSDDEASVASSFSGSANNDDSLVQHSVSVENLGDLSRHVDALNLSSQSSVDASFEDNRLEEEMVRGPPSDPEESDFEDNDEEVFSEDANEYLLDSFCVNDEEEEEDSEEESDESDDEEGGDRGPMGSDSVFEAEGEPVTPSRLQPTRRCKYTPSRSTPSRQVSKPRSPLDTTSNVQDDLLKELYPELYQDGKLSVDLTMKSEDDFEGRNESCFSAGDRARTEPRTPTQDDSQDSDDDSLNKYLEKLRIERESANLDDSRDCDGFRDDDFIVGDDSDVTVEDSDSEDFVFSSDEASDEDDDEADKENNEWTEERRKAREEWKKKKTAKLSSDEHFLISLSEDYDEEKYGRRHAEAAQFVGKKLTKSTREKLCPKLFAIFNEKVFDNQLPADIPISWNPRMLTTAGFARCSKRPDGVTRFARIELAPKVCTFADRTRDTLLHELCHAAVHIIDEVREKHGPTFKKWAAHCHHRLRDLPFVTRCHNYKIEKKFAYACGGCAQVIHRHSKSFDVTKKVCGICRGRFVLQSSSDKPSRAPSKFALYVKEHYGPLKKRGYRHGHIMKTLGEQFKALKINSDDGETATSLLDNKENEGSSSYEEREEPAAPLPAASSTVPGHAAEQSF